MTLAQCCSISKTGYQKLKFLRQTSFLRRSKVFLRRLLSIMPTLSTQLIQWIVNQLRNGVIESKAVCCIIVPASWECKIQTSRVAVQCLQCHVAAFTNHTSVSTVAQLAHVQSEKHVAILLQCQAFAAHPCWSGSRLVSTSHTSTEEHVFLGSKGSCNHELFDKTR